MPSNSKQEIISSLDEIVLKLKKIHYSINSLKIFNITRQNLKEETREITSIWFDQIKHNLLKLGLNSEIMTVNSGFEKLLYLSSRTSRRQTYLSCISEIQINIERQLKVDITKHAVDSSQLFSLSHIAENATSDEIEYLTEAIHCANADFFRASIILGWSAAIARIQKVIEKKGFDEFNKKSVEMKGKTKGRYKRFSKSFDIGSTAELQTIFDTDLLWILEYWGLIDTNEHDRLEICFIMRNNSAHPGEAPITPENLLSFYSDLKTMVFDNDEFKM